MWVRKTRIKMKRSLKFWEETLKSAWKLRVNENKQTEYTKKLMKLEIHRGRGQIQQCVQDNGRGPGLAGYAMWKSDTKSAAWVSSDAGIHSDLSLVFSYPSQITLYRSLYAYWWSILESTIWEISYSGFPSIMTGAGASCILSEKVLDVAVLWFNAQKVKQRTNSCIEWHKRTR